MPRIRALALSFGFVGTLASTAAAADAAAEALFQDALRLMKRGQFAEACPKLEASQRREPRSGTLLNLAACEEQLGHTATAWALYNDAASLAREEKKAGYADKATRLAEAVAQRLTYLRFEVAPGQTPQVSVDGRAIAPEALQTPMPVDPGSHVIEASAAGYAPWRAELRVAHTVTLTIPALVADAPVAAPESAPPALPTSTDDAPPLTPARVPVWAWSTGGVGVALIASSVVFRVLQAQAGKELDQRCGRARDACDAGYDFASTRDREQRDFALFVSLGAVGFAATGVATYGLVRALRAAPPQHTARLVPVLAFGPGALRAGLSGEF